MGFSDRFLSFLSMEQQAFGRCFGHVPEIEVLRCREDIVLGSSLMGARVDHNQYLSLPRLVPLLPLRRSGVEDVNDVTLPSLLTK